MLKDFTLSLELEPTENRVVQTAAIFWSHDVNTAKIYIELLRKGTPIILNKDVTVRVMMLFDDENKSEHIYTAKIEDELKGLVSITLEESMRAYVGQVTCGVYVDYQNEEKTDNGYFTFGMRRSLIDKDMPELQKLYVTDFEKALKDIKEFKVDIDKNINDMQENFDNKYDKAKTDVENIEKLIANNDVVKKTDLGNVDDFRPFDKDIISKIKNEFTERAINVVWFGAKGDGTSDDTKSIKNAIDVANKTSKKVYLPAGNYVITDTIKIPEGITFFGAGSHSNGRGSTILTKISNVDAIETDGDRSNIVGVSVYGGKGNGSGDGFYIKHARVTLQNCEARGLKGDSYRIGGKSTTTEFNANIFSLINCISTEAGRDGLHIDDSFYGTLPNAGAGSVLNLDIRGSNRYGVYVNHSMDVIFYNPVLQHNNLHNVYLDNKCMSAKFLGHYTESVATEGNAEIYITENARRNIFFGGRDMQYTREIVDNGKQNLILSNDQQNFDVMSLNALQFNKLEISDSAISGRWEMKQNKTNRDLEVSLIGTGANANVKVNHGLSAERLLVKGREVTQPIFGGSTVGYRNLKPMEVADVDVSFPGLTPSHVISVSTKTKLSHNICILNASCFKEDVATIRFYNPGPSESIAQDVVTRLVAIQHPW